MTDFTAALPTVRTLLDAAARIEANDPAGADRLLRPHLKDPLATGLAVAAIIDLAVRLAAFTGNAVSMGTSLVADDGGVGELRPVDEAPRYLRVATVMANHMASHEVGQAMSVWIDAVNAPGDDDPTWPGAVLVLALRLLHQVQDLTPPTDDKVGQRVLRVR